MNTLLKRTLIIGLVLTATMVMMVYAVSATPSYDVVAVSATTAGTTEDGLDYDPYDIIALDWGYWYTLFNGEDHGLSNKHNIDAFSIAVTDTVGVSCGLECVDAIYMSFAQDAVPVPGIPIKVKGQDIVEFEPGTGYFSVYFDGSDVSLTTASEKIDSLDVWEGWEISANNVEFPYDCPAGILFIGTRGAYRVPAANGGSLVGDGSDVLIFCATNLGDNTAGFWFRGFDSSDEGFAQPQVMYGIDVHDYYAYDPLDQVEDEAALLYFTFVVNKTFSVPNAAGGPSEVFVYPDCGDDVFGPIRDFNSDEPALNGTVAGYDNPNGLGPLSVDC